MILIATIGGLLALLFWGLSDYFTGKSGQEADAYLTNLVVQLMGVIFLLPIVLWYGLSISISTSLIVVVVTSLLFTIAYIFFIKSLASGPFGVAAPLANSYAFITLLLGFLFLQFQVSALQLFALVIIIVGVIALAVDRATLDYKNFRGSTIYFAAITALLWGSAFALIETVIDEFAWYELLFMISVLITTLSFLFYVVIRKRIPIWNDIRYKSMKYAWHSGVLLSLGAIAFFVAAERSGSVVIPAVIASASPLITSFMAYWRDEEELPLYKRVGAIIIILGLIALNF